MKRALSCAAAGLCLALALFFLLPLCAGILHFGMLWPAAVLTGAAAVLLWPDFFRRLLRPKWLRRTIACAVAICLAAVLVTLGKMVQSAGHRPTGDAPCTVVVLGCTHYPLLTGVIGYEMGEGVTLVSSAEETAKDVYRVLREHDLLRPDDAPPPTHGFTTTGDPAEFRRLATRFLGLGSELGELFVSLPPAARRD